MRVRVDEAGQEHRVTELAVLAGGGAGARAGVDDPAAVHHHRAVRDGGREMGSTQRAW